jgi:hypothetical protein
VLQHLVVELWGQFLGVDLQTGDGKQPGGYSGVNQQIKIAFFCIASAENRPKYAGAIDRTG